MAADSSCVESTELWKSTDHNASVVKNESRSQFKATDFWNEAVASVKTNVELKRKRIKLRSYDECFTGSEAVDVAYQFLQHHKENLANKEITRDKAVKLCQLMLSSHVFEPVQQKFKDGNPDESQTVQFQDSSGKVYRFLDDLATENEYSKDSTPTCSNACGDCTDLDSLSCRVNVDMDSDSIGEMVICNNNIFLNDQGEEELLNITGHGKSRLSFRRLKRALTPANLFNKRTPTSRDSHSAKSKLSFSAAMFSRLPPAVQDEIYREVALAHLLTLVDIPMLELILSYEYSSHKHTVKALTFSNLALSRYESFTSLISDPGGDKWMEAAMDCLECLPNGVDILDESLAQQATDLTQKLCIFQHIADYYSALPQPLWSNNFADLHIALLNILLQGKIDVVFKAVQLSLILLPSSLREEMTRLLVFMKCCADDETMQLSSTESNRIYVEKMFTKAVINSQVLNGHQCSLLVMFMVERSERISLCPEDTEEKILYRLELELNGGGDAAVYESSYCKRVSVEEQKRQTATATETALVALMNTIIDDTKLPLKEKKQKLKQFKSTHPQIFEMHFSNLLE